jgi:signal transduction histidine kinase
MDLRELLADALARMVQTFGADGGSGYLLEGGHLVRQVFLGTLGSGEPAPIPRLPSDQGAPGEAMRTLVPVPLARGGDDLRPLAPGAGERPHGVALPLVVRNRALGVFLLERRESGAFQPGELRLLAAVAAQVGVAVENARLFEDLTRSYVDLGRAQKKLVHRERLAALGELSAVVAHEVRNPLAVIFNSLGSLQRILQPRGDAKLLLDVIQEEADRLNRTVGDLLDFARPAEPTLRPESLERVVEDSVNAALAHDPPEVVVQRDYDPGLAPVPLDARQVRQAVLNLAVNALQSMPRGGQLTVRTRAEGAGARVEVADTGGGVPPGIRQKVFEPFFTTKPTGTGLGLAVVRRIAEGHGGSVELCDEPGGGACFVLHFPGPLPDLSPEVPTP